MAMCTAAQWTKREVNLEISGGKKWMNKYRNIKKLFISKLICLHLVLSHQKPLCFVWIKYLEFSENDSQIFKIK